MQVSRQIRRLALVPLVVGALLLSPAAASAQAEQIVFSGVGFGTFDGTPSPFGFWIWCQDENPGDNYEQVCAGSMYFYALALVRPTFGGIVSESGDSFTIAVASPDGDIECTLTNSTANRGPTNTVDADCSSPGGSGTSTNSVVVVSPQGP